MLMNEFICQGGVEAGAHVLESNGTENVQKNVYYPLQLASE